MTSRSSDALIEITRMLEEAGARLRRLVIRNSLILAAMLGLVIAILIELWITFGYQQSNAYLVTMMVILLTIPASSLIATILFTTRTKRALAQIHAGRLEKARFLLSSRPPWRPIPADTLNMVTEASKKLDTAIRDEQLGSANKSESWTLGRGTNSSRASRFR